MPRVYLSAEERIRAERQSNTRRKGNALERLMSNVKHKVGYHDIAKKSGISYGTVCKIVNNPLSARVEQLLHVAEICGLDLVIVERKEEQSNVC